MMSQKLLAISFIIILLLISIQPVGAVKLLKVYRFPLEGDLPTHIAVESKERIWLSLPSRQAIALFNPETNDVTLINVPGMPGKIVYHDGYIIGALSREAKVVVVDCKTFKVATYDLRGEVVDIYTSTDGVWLSLPDVSKLVKFSPKDMKILLEMDANVAYGEGVIAEVNGKLWMIEKDYMSLLLLDIVSRASRKIEFKNQTYLVAATKDGDAWVVDINGNLMRITQDMKIVEKVSLPFGTIVAPPLLSSDFDSIVYFSRVTHTAGEVFKGEVSEIKLGYMSPWHPTKAPDGTFWFIDISFNTIALISISRPPMVKDVKIEKIKTNTYAVYAYVDDREMDVKDVLLVIESYIDGKLYTNETMYLSRKNGYYYAENSINIQDGSILLKVVAIDSVGNLARFDAGSLLVKNGEILILRDEAQTKDQFSQTFILISELILLIPLALAVIYFIMRRKRHKRR